MSDLVGKLVSGWHDQGRYVCTHQMAALLWG